MKHLNLYIQEKLHVSKYQDKYDPDELNSNNYVLYDCQSYESDDEEALEWEDCLNTLDLINKNYDNFIVCKFDSLGYLMKTNNHKNIEKVLWDYSNELTNIHSRIITGDDLGYDVRIKGGHIEIDCVNSGSRATYYIYAINNESYEKVEEWFDTPESLDGNDDYEKLNFLFEKGNILTIEI